MPDFELVVCNKENAARKAAMRHMIESNGTTGGYNHLIKSVISGYGIGRGYLSYLREAVSEDMAAATMAFIRYSLAKGDTVYLYYTDSYVVREYSGEATDLLQISPEGKLGIPLYNHSNDYQIKHINLGPLQFSSVSALEESLANNLRLARKQGREISGYELTSDQTVNVFAINKAGEVSFITKEAEKIIANTSNGFTDIKVLPFTVEGDNANVTASASKTENETKLTTKQDNKMSNVKTTATAVVSKNKSAAVTAGKLEAGRIAVKQVAKLVTPKLPMMVRGYADTPVGRLVMANLFNFAVTQFAANNKNALLVADAMLEGAMLETLQSFNIEELINDVINKVDVSKLVDASDSE